MNQRPPGYEPDELPTALPRDVNFATDAALLARPPVTLAIIAQEHS